MHVCLIPFSHRNKFIYASLENYQELFSFWDFLTATFEAIQTNVSSPHVHLSVLDQVADSRDTVIDVLCNLHDNFKIGESTKYLTVEGDAKIFEIEKTRQDSSHTFDNHEHLTLNDQTIIPSKWRQIIECRVCKCGLVSYLGQRFLTIAPKYIKGDQKFYVGGSSEGDDCDKVWYISSNGIKKIAIEMTAIMLKKQTQEYECMWQSLTVRKSLSSLKI